MVNVTSKLADQEYEIVHDGEVVKYQIVPQFSSTLRKQLFLHSSAGHRYFSLNLIGEELEGEFEMGNWLPEYNIVLPARSDFDSVLEPFFTNLESWIKTHAINFFCDFESDISSDETNSEESDASSDNN